MIVHCKYDKMIPVNELISHPKNRNDHSKDQIERLAKILSYQGLRAPIVVSTLTGFIVKGHGTLEAIKKNKWPDAPVVLQDFETSDQEYAFLTSDNAIASWSELDLSGINTDIGDLGPDFNIDMLGIKDFVLELAEKIPQCDEDEVPEAKESICKLGDIWRLGDHRLMCGDSTNIQHVEFLMNGEKADMVFTDPPYGMNLDTDYTKMSGNDYKDKDAESKKYNAVIGDNKKFDPGIIHGAFDYVSEVFLWGADYYAESLIDKNNGSWIVWDKREDGTGVNLDKRFGSQFELCWSKQKHRREIARIRWAGFFGTEKEFDRKRCHPTQKPTALIEWFFQRYDGQKVVDLFGGSGSTMIACEKTNRKCFMLEIDTHYCDVIIARWEKYTGKKAELTNAQTH